MVGYIASRDRKQRDEYSEDFHLSPFQAVWSPVYVIVPPAFNVCLPPLVKELWKQSPRQDPSSTPEMMTPLSLSS